MFGLVELSVNGQSSDYMFLTKVGTVQSNGTCKELSSADKYYAFAANGERRHPDFVGKYSLLGQKLFNETAFNSLKKL
ncbi:MAG: hypothetical protein LBG52_02265 [Candidatus Peribacteria bacterium]|jgi:hypothetical protein|nr:hypothetical protein [Candidatus Peribacteria bacterium]